jgi:hypothetical protein
MAHRSKLVLAASALGFFSSCASTHEDGGHNWKEGRHHLATFLGTTIEENENAPTIGVDYEFRINQHIGLGAVAEHAIEDLDATTILAVADLYIANNLAVQTGPGIEFLDNDELFVYRVGAVYEWEFEGYTLSPQVHYDVTNGPDAWILGIAFGVGF